jgi:hypothetical protein
MELIVQWKVIVQHIQLKQHVQLLWDQMEYVIGKQYLQLIQLQNVDLWHVQIFPMELHYKFVKLHYHHVYQMEQIVLVKPIVKHTIVKLHVIQEDQMEYVYLLHLLQ